MNAPPPETPSGLTTKAHVAGLSQDLLSPKPSVFGVVQTNITPMAPPPEGFANVTLFCQSLALHFIASFALMGFSRISAPPARRRRVRSHLGDRLVGADPGRRTAAGRLGVARTPSRPAAVPRPPQLPLPVARSYANRLAAASPWVSSLGTLLKLSLVKFKFRVSAGRSPEDEVV